MNVLGIDPAPGKKSTVFDGEKFENFTGLELHGYISELKDTFICWDAPLGIITQESSSNGKFLTTRTIESFFMSKAKGIKPPRGISVLPYSGCSHWAVSQYIFGLPVINREYDGEFQLLGNSCQKSLLTGGLWVTEVHPALAMWLWTQGSVSDESFYNYKKNLKKCRYLFEELQHIPCIGGITNINANDILSDDYLDAYTAWVIGELFLLDKGDVILLGDEVKGSFLIPDIEYKGLTVKERFKSFADSDL